MIDTTMAIHVYSSIEGKVGVVLDTSGYVSQEAGIIHVCFIASPVTRGRTSSAE